MKDVAEMAIKLMAASARTAPKAGGKDFLEIVVITKDEDFETLDDRGLEFLDQKDDFKRIARITRTGIAHETD